VNPHAGSHSRDAIVDEIAGRLARDDFRVERVSDIDELSALAAERLAAGTLRAIVAGGGDGTLRLIASRTAPGTPLLVLPLGTENLLAKHLEISTDPELFCRIVAAGRTVRLDAGEANGRLFSLMAGCGFDADVVRRVHEQRSGHIHQLSYAKPILDAIRNYDYPELRVYLNPTGEVPSAAAAVSQGAGGFTHQISARWVFVVNLPRYARGLSFAPEASGTDGLLDICTFKEGSLWSGLWYLGGVMLGQHQEMSDFTHIRTAHVRIEADARVPFQLDGDSGDELPLDVRVLPRRLTLLVSESWAGEAEEERA
jgi:diacylglycerol kinase family enzyme